ncbi:MAG: DUF397 domain-containing protein [Pseudonocardiaceae bacterium]
MAPAPAGQSSRSNHGGEGNCVEAAELPGRVAMRDSKDPAGPVLVCTRAEWHAFLDALRTSTLG